MQPEDLQYDNFPVLLRQQSFTGRTQSASFLAWFLENVLRLDEVSSADAICDGPADRGIDGVLVDNNTAEIIMFQAKIRQNDDRTIGDQPIREFAGSIAQFNSQESIQKIVEESPNSELSKILKRTKMADLVGEGYSVKGYFVTNSRFDQAAVSAAIALCIRGFDREGIAEQFIEIDAPAGIQGSVDFDVSDIGCLEFKAGNAARLFLLTAKAADLLNLGGLSDGTLFSQNVRLNLGKTKVNKDIAGTVSNSDKHIFFPMYHNGITLICEEVERPNNDVLKVTGYVVVNGAQSLSVLYENRDKATEDLRFIIKIIEIKDNNALSRDITLFSNNQNSIKPRDLRSNHLLQTRLQAEFEQINFEDYRYEIKRGEPVDGHAISNEDAGRQLLAFDLGEPWSCHQISKLFDDKHSEIFGRPLVTAWRIILLSKMMDCIERSLVEIGSEPIQRYSLTKYFLIFSISRIVENDIDARNLFFEPEKILRNGDLTQNVLNGIESICKRLCVDLRFELVTTDNPPDYKALLKSQTRVQELEQKLRRSFEQDVARGRDKRISENFGEPIAVGA